MTTHLILNNYQNTTLIENNVPTSTPSFPITQIALDRIQSSIPSTDSPPIMPQCSITLTKKVVSEADVDEMIKNNPGITTLNLIDCYLFDGKAVQKLAQLRSLKHLNLSGCMVKNNVKYIAACTSLEHLNLSRCFWEHNSPLGIDHLSQLPFLKHLNLSYCHISDDELGLLGKLPSLEELDLSQCDITDKGLEKLSACHSLKWLNLAKNTSITNKGLEYIGKIDALNELDISDSHKVTIKGLEQLKQASLFLHLGKYFFPSRITQKDLESVAFLLQKGVRMKVELQEFLYPAVAYQNKDFAKWLLKNGCDPDKSVEGFDFQRTTCLKEACQSDDLGMIALLLSYRKDKEAALPDFKTLPKKYLKKLEYQKIIAKGLGPIFPSRTIRLYSSFARSKLRDDAISFAADRLLEPLSSCQYAINPIRNFALKETASNRAFSVYIMPKPEKWEREPVGGEYDPETGDILIYPLRSYLSFDEDARASSFDSLKLIDATTLLHEFTHKVFDKLGWNSENRKTQMKEFKAAAIKDLLKLSSEQEMSWDPDVTRTLLTAIVYSEDMQFEEFLVRTVESISILAHKNPSWTQNELETNLSKNIPNLYKIFKEHFLPELEDYDQRISAHTS